MVKTIAIVVVVLLVVSVTGVLLLAVSKPDTFRVQRATSVKAPPDRIFPLIADFHGWSAWSPYEKLDPAMKRTFGGADKGKGAVYEWDSDGKAGKGRMEITDAPAPSRVAIKLDFFKPFESHNTAEFKLEPSGDTTEAMYGPNLFIGKVRSIFFDMDKMIGKDFETGLANLKILAEQKPADATTSRR
jgi:uncharacterized protein YndB with AHSA1/START domain